jgi:hypothetical protein
MQVPGLQGMGFASMVTSLSCASTGDCAVVGFATSTAAGPQGIDADDVGGVWGRSAYIPGLRKINERPKRGARRVVHGLVPLQRRRVLPVLATAFVATG